MWANVRLGRIAFAFLALLLCVQVVVHRLGGEPYPAISLPSFGGASGSYSDGVTFRRTMLVAQMADGRRKTCTISKLCPTVPASNYARIAALLRPNRPSQQAPQKSYYKFLPGLQSKKRHQALPLDQRIDRQWLRDRLHSALGEAPVSAEIQLIDEHWKAGEQPTRQFIESETVQFLSR